MINSELLKKVSTLEEPSQTFLKALLEDIEKNKQNEEVQSALRSKIRDYVAKETKL